MADLPEIDLTFNVKIKEAIVIRPDDTLIVRVDDPSFRPEDAQELREQIKRRLPERVKVVVVCADQLAVARGGEGVSDRD